jgi:linoleoyl-CoA desaturase
VLANMFQLAHCVEEAEFFSAGDQLTSFELRQLHSTVDVRCGVPALRPAMRWIMGGLDHQIEHHLAPRLPHTVYRVIAPRLALECAQRDVPYRMHPTVIGALRSHARLLGRMGKRPSQAAGQLLSSSVLVTSSTLR